MTKEKSNRIALLIEILLTLCICSIIVTTVMKNVQNNAGQFTAEIERDYKRTIDDYITTFGMLKMHVTEEIKKDPDFDEMNLFLQSHEEIFKDIIGEDVYDGFAMTYKGGYARSWSYGDYTDYDATTRPWYQQAQQANGNVTVIAPYVTYLDPSYLEDDEYILMSIAQKYNEEITFDYDLKIKGLNQLIGNRKMDYGETTSILYNPEGYIISASDEKFYCHNVTEEDAVLSKDMVKEIARIKSHQNRLHLERMNGMWQVVYADAMDDGNTIFVMIPFQQVFVDNILAVVLIALLLILLELFLYFANIKRNREVVNRDHRLREITRVTFESEMYVDLHTMICTEETGARKEKASGYEVTYGKIYQSITGESARIRFAEFLSPKSIQYLPEGVLLREEFPVARYEGKKLKETRMVQYSVIVTKIRGRKYATILVNDVTREDSRQQQILESVAFHYTDLYVFNTKTEESQYIKVDEYHAKVFRSGAAPEELNERFARRYIKPEYFEQYMEMSNIECIAGKLQGRDSLDLTYEQKDGHWKTLRIMKSIGYEENHLLIICIEDADNYMRQQSALREALARAEKATKAKTEFLANMSHDIRTPMNAIVNLTRLAKEDAPEESRQLMDDLNKIETSSNFLLGLINDILDMSRIESGKMELHPTVYSFEKYENYISSIIVPLCEQKGIHFRWNQGTTKLPVYVDQIRFNQIFFNVLSNAVKYTEPGGEVVLYEKNNSVHGDILSVDFAVKDNGCGMSEEFQQKLFQPFERENTVEAYSGTGLGLVITREIIEKMGGNIKIYSVKGEGTEVVMHFELSIVRDEKLLQEKESITRPEAGRKRKLRILAAEDHELNRQIIRRLLEKRGCTVECAENGQIACDMMEEKPEGYYDLILMDLRMPIKNGLEATKEIRQMQHRDGKSIPIIAMTADAFSEDVDRCLKAGMNGHLSKPISVEALYEMIDRFVSD